MTVTVTIPTEADLRKHLKWLARHWCGMRDCARELMLCAVVHESLDEPLKLSCTCGTCLTCTWDAYAGDLKLHDEFTAGEVDWRDIEPGLTCPDKQGQAAEDIAARVAGLEDVLLRGWPGKKVPPCG